MSEMNRRDLLKLLGTSTAAGMLGITEETELRAREAVHDAQVEEIQTGAQYAPKFFSPHEYRTVRVLVDYIIPRDERSGSATDAGVPQYIDFLMADQTPAGPRQAPTQQQIALHAGLAWLDRECGQRFGGKTFVACADAERRQVLDDIAWPAKAKQEMAAGVAFFTRMRDLTGAGFFSSKMGVQDLGYTGNRPVAAWDGCPPQVLRTLGLPTDA